MVCLIRIITAVVLFSNTVTAIQIFDTTYEDLFVDSKRSPAITNQWVQTPDDQLETLISKFRAGLIEYFKDKCAEVNSVGVVKVIESWQRSQEDVVQYQLRAFMRMNGKKFAITVEASIQDPGPFKVNDVEFPFVNSSVKS